MKRGNLAVITHALPVLLVVALSLTPLIGCAEQATAPATDGISGPQAKSSEPASAPKPAVSQFEVIQAAAEAYLTSDKAKNSNVKAEDLYYNLNDGNAANDPFIVEVRAAADYEKGHIPGAINIPWREIAKKENLAKLPKDKPIVVYCYTGQTGSQVTAILNTLGYDVKNLRYGMASWTKDENVAPNRLDPEKTPKDYKIESRVNVPAQVYSFPVVDNTSAADEFEIIRAAADAYLSSDRGKNANIKAEDLFYNLNDGNAANDPQVLSVRSKADYEIGHIPGAINIPWQEVVRKDNLARLAPDKPIAVYCYTGHTGSQASAILNMLGYETRNLQHGIGSWTKDMEVVKTRFDNSKDSKDYKFVSGPNPR
ncbi:MAG: rhodanese-like domain-containing protein [Chloroflexi bacterium]|nr:rhodanese-like domain-containing protein [Chloroflexota bacterium]